MVLVEKSKILVVDDTPENLKLLQGLLKEEYKIFAVPNGEIALSIAKSQQPDLILLDVMMPDIDGYQVCTKLKSNNSTKEIPIIFITAKTETIDEVKGFEVGGVDYITKPINPKIVLARIKAQLALRREQKLLKENLSLREDVERIMRHDLKQPLSPILAYPKLLLQKEKSEQNKKFLEQILKAGYRLLNMINLSLDLYKMENNTYEFIPATVDLIPVLKEVILDNKSLFNAKHSRADILLNETAINDDNVFEIQGDKLLILSLFGNLIKNAAEATPKSKNVTISLRKNHHSIIEIHNYGVVPEAVRESFFMKYATSGKSQGTGLGTYSAKLITETIGGKIEMETSDFEGTTIRLTF